MLTDTKKCEAGSALDRQRRAKPNRHCNDETPYSTLPIFFTAATSRALSSATNFENSGAS
jgi:hypothetical protein